MSWVFRRVFQIATGNVLQCQSVIVLSLIEKSCICHMKKNQNKCASKSMCFAHFVWATTSLSPRREKEFASHSRYISDLKTCACVYYWCGSYGVWSMKKVIRVKWTPICKTQECLSAISIYKYTYKDRCTILNEISDIYTHIFGALKNMLHALPVYIVL